MCKFSSQGLIPCHSSDQSHDNDNARFLTHWATEEFLFVLFLMIAILTGMRHLTVILICTSLISDVQHLLNICWPLVCLLVRSVYSGPVSLFQSAYLFSCYWIVWVLYIFWILTPYPMYVLPHHRLSPDCSEAFEFDATHLPVISFVAYAICSQPPPKSLLRSMSRSFFPCVFL